jgi:hypothetical protein
VSGLRCQEDFSTVLLLKTAKHFLPELSRIIKRASDPRNLEQCVYSQAHLLWSGVLLFMMHLGSRRQLRFERIGDAFAENLALLSGQSDLGLVADPDTLAYYAQRVAPSRSHYILAKPGLTSQQPSMHSNPTFLSPET